MTWVSSEVLAGKEVELLRNEADPLGHTGFETFANQVDEGNKAERFREAVVVVFVGFGEDNGEELFPGEGMVGVVDARAVEFADVRAECGPEDAEEGVGDLVGAWRS